MSVNLLRNSRVFFTTNVDTADPNKGVVNLVNFSSSNTFEIQVLDDISFSQSTNAETISLNEAGSSPNRSQRSFNTSLNPVEFSFTTYMRPRTDKTNGVITSVSATIPPGLYGPKTTVIVDAPASGRQAALTPQFTNGNLTGFGIADGGTGYSAGPLAATVVDPDTASEGTAVQIEVTGVTSGGTNGIIKCEESVLWNAMFAADAIGGTNPAWANGSNSTSSVTPATCVLTNSNVHQLQRFGMIITFDQNTYILDDCSLNQAVIDFGIDAIASIQWSGQARKLRRITSPTEDPTTHIWSGSLTGTYLPRVTDCPYIANKLTTVTLKSGIGVFGTAPSGGSTSTYTLPITGGSITLTNNITYLTPANIGVVNTPFTYFTGSRSITGSLNAYLRTGTSPAKESANLFDDLISQVATDSDPQFYIQVEIGGGSSDTHVDLEMPACVLQIPTVNSEAVITTTVNFTAQSSATVGGNNIFNILNNNEIKLKYYSAL